VGVDIDEHDLEKVVKILKSLGSRKIDVAANEEEVENLYQIRSMAFLAVKHLAPACQVEDVTVPLDRLGEYFDMVKQIASEHDLRIPVMGHAGDGNVHPTILYDPSNPSSKKAASEAFEEICRQAIAMGGTITGEHGIGIQKVKLLKEQMESHDGIEALRLMKETKRLFDPKGIMNPGKYVEAA